MNIAASDSPQYRSVKPFTLSVSKGLVAGQQGFDPSTSSGQAKLSLNGVW